MAEECAYVWEFAQHLMNQYSVCGTENHKHLFYILRWLSQYFIAFVTSKSLIANNDDSLPNMSELNGKKSLGKLYYTLNNLENQMSSPVKTSNTLQCLALGSLRLIWFMKHCVWEDSLLYRSKDGYWFWGSCSYGPEDSSQKWRGGGPIKKYVDFPAFPL